MASVDDDPDQVDAVDEVAEALAAFGLVSEAPLLLDDEFWLWPECEAPFRFWLSIQTQWVAANGIPTGLNYAGVDAAMKLARVPKRDRSELFALVQTMESACLNMWHRECK